MWRRGSREAWSSLILIALSVSGCRTREHVEPLGVDSASPTGSVQVEMLLRTGGTRTDAWVARIRRAGAAGADLVLPSLPSNEDDSSVSRRKPRILWGKGEDRFVVETIRSAFLVVYLPTDAPPFVCEHRVVDPEDAYDALQHTPTLAKLEEEILTEDDKPHDAEEQQYVLRRLERAGATSPAASVLVPAVLRSSAAMDRARLVRLAVARLRPGSGLQPAVRDSELARLRTALEDFTRMPDQQHAALVPRIVEVLGALPREEGEAPVVRALETAVARSAYSTGAADVLPAVGPLAWLAGKWRLADAGPALQRYLEARNEVPWKTRVARNLALWASVRLANKDAIVATVPLVAAPDAWVAGGTRQDVPEASVTELSPAWADDTTLGVVFAWAARTTNEVRVIPALQAATALSVPAARKQAAQRALAVLTPPS